MSLCHYFCQIIDRKNGLFSVSVDFSSAPNEISVKYGFKSDNERDCQFNIACEKDTAEENVFGIATQCTSAVKSNKLECSCDVRLGT